MGIVYFGTEYDPNTGEEIFKGNYKDGYRDGSGELYKKSIQLNPKIPEANTNLGNLYSSIGKNNESIKYHKLAISADPKYFYTYLNIANVYVSIGNFIEAKKYLNEAIIQNPNFSFAHRLLSRITKYSKDNLHLAQLKNLYNKMAKGGIIAFDEYALQGHGESDAVDEFLSNKKIKLKSFSWAKTPTAYIIIK